MCEELLEILACPICKGPLRTDESSLVCETCRLRYPVRDGIPVLLAEEAERIGKMRN
ncbi:MAG: Trm112 family protein [Geobacteraceae bacterium]|nr:Trm112 family protein [Geobacteraceae bacterium]